MFVDSINVFGCHQPCVMIVIDYFRLEVLQIVFIVIGVIMALFAVLLMIFGFLATGATRKNVYSGAKCIMGGRISAGFVSYRNEPV